MGSLMSYEYVKDYIDNKTSCRLISEKYEGSVKKLELQCSCGNLFYKSWNEIYTKNKWTCNECSEKRRRINIGKGNKFSLEFIKSEVDKYGYLLLDDEYTDANNYINVENKEDHYRYSVRISQIRRGNMRKFFSTNAYNNYNFLLWMKENDVTGFDLIESKFENNRTCFYLRCKKCTEVFENTINNLRKGMGCPYCGHRKVGRFNNLKFLFPEICEEWDYSKNKKDPSEYMAHSNEKVHWVCGVCDHKWKTGIGSRTGIMLAGCPRCSQSKGEKSVRKFLDNENIPYIHNFTIEGCKNIRPLKFDYAIFFDEEKTKLNFLIEYDGELHYRPYHKMPKGMESFNDGKKRDRIKNEYCKDNSIVLIRIPYWDYKNIESILTRELNLPRKEENLFG